MSIKYLQDQQLNQVQQSPNDSPWAKLVAQSEMLERNKMRQPQGQAPQGTVAGNIQQQLMAAQQQESEKQNADLQKAQMIAQLIGSGHLPTNFAAQGYAGGGLTQPQAGTGAYRGIMMPSQGAGANPSYAPQQPVLSYIPPSSQDPNAQEKKHGMLQTLLDNSMYSGKGTIDSNMQMYSDMLTGKLFGRGFAEGGDVRGFAAGGESMAEQLARIKPQIEATLRDQGWTKEAIDRYVSAYKPEMGRGFTNQFPATTAQPPSFEDMLNLQRRKAAQTSVGIKPFTAEPEPPRPFQQAAEERAARLREELQLAPHREAAEARAAKLQAIQQQAAGAQRALPAPGPTSASSLEAVLGKDANVQDFIKSLNAKQAAASNVPTQPQEIPTAPQVKALPHITQVSESPELQDYYKSLYGPKPEATRGDVLSQLGKANAPEEAQVRIPTREDMMRQAQGTSTGTDSLAEFKNRMYGENTGALNAPRSNLMGTLLNVAEQKEALANQPKPSMTEQMSAAAKQNPLDTMWAKMSEADRLNAMHRASVQPETAPTPSMTEGMSAAAQNPPRVDTMASQMSAADQANSAAKAEAIKAAKSSLIGKGIRSLGLGMGPSAVESMSDIIAPEDWAAKNKALDTGGMHGALGWYAGKVGEGFKQGNERIAQNMSGLGDTIKSNITQPLNEFWNGPNAGAQTNAPPSVPQTDISQFGVDTKAAIPQQPTIGDFSGSATPQAQTPQQGVRKREDGVIINSKSAGKAPDANENVEVRNKIFNQGSDTNTTEGHPVGDAATKTGALTQAMQAADKTSDTGMGQGSILDSLYSKLKDTDVDYSDLAKRISENEYDLARERKDGTFNAILGGVGAALSKAGTYESHGDRVFRPGYGAIAGAGITGGLKMSSESDAEIDKKSQANTASMLALKKLKGDSLNNVLDAISAQKQNEVYAQSVANNAIAHRDTAANQKVENSIKWNQLTLNAEQIAQDAAYKQGMIEKARNELPAEKQGSADLLKAQLSQYTAAYTDLLKTPGIMPNDPRVIAASKRLNSTNAMIDTLLQGLGNNVSLTPSTDNVGTTSGGMTLLNVRDK